MIMDYDDIYWWYNDIYWWLYCVTSWIVMMDYDDIYWWLYCVLSGVSVIIATYVIESTDDDVIGKTDNENIKRIRRVAFRSLKAALVFCALCNSWYIKAIVPVVFGLTVLIVNAFAIHVRNKKKSVTDYHLRKSVGQ